MLNVDFTTTGKPTIEDLTLQVDGVRVLFTTTLSFTEVIRVFRNGNRQTESDDYTAIAPNSILFAVAPKVHPRDGQERIVAEFLE